MVSKDQGIGGIIFIVCLAIVLLYVVTLFYPQWLEIFGISVNATPSMSDRERIRFWVIAVPVFIAFVAVMCIGMWIGWTMATTPPPKPIEEITSEIEEEKEEKVPEEAEEEEKTKAKKKN